jgi:hypothetical protein
VVWLENQGSAPEIVMATFDDRLQPVLEPRTIAAVGPTAQRPLLLGQDDTWLLLWLEGSPSAPCANPAWCGRLLHTLSLPATLDSGTAVDEPSQPWPEERIFSSLAHGPAADNHLIAFVGNTADGSTALRVRGGLLNAAGQAVGNPAELAAGETPTNAAPALAWRENELFLLFGSLARGIRIASLSPSTGQPLGEPSTLVNEPSATRVAAASRGNRIGVLYVALTSSEDGPRLWLTELAQQGRYRPVSVTDGLQAPTLGQIVPAGNGWLVTWTDGRLDDSPECVNSQFCREDVYLVAADLSGPSGEPLRLSANDPHDCHSPSSALLDSTLGTVWQTEKDRRPTLMMANIPCS